MMNKLKKASVRTEAFCVVREAGLEPARPEWTLEPEFIFIRFGMYRRVSLSTAKAVENTDFLALFDRKASNHARCKKPALCWMFVGCFYRIHSTKEFM